MKIPTIITDHTDLELHSLSINETVLQLYTGPKTFTEIYLNSENLDKLIYHLKKIRNKNRKLKFK